MQARFIAQSFDTSLEESAGKEILHSLASGRFSSLLAMSAFASPSGVNTLRAAIEAVALQACFIVGVDQQGTSKEALEALLDFQTAYPAASIWVFYQPESVIYHPKLYLLEGIDEVQVLIGSSNLTGNGLFRNVEAGTLLTLFPADADDATWLDTFRLQLAGFYDLSDPNLQPLSAELIAEVVAEGLVPDEATVRQRYAKTKPTKPATATAGKQRFPKRKTAARPASSSPRRAAHSRVKSITTSSVSDFELVWERVGLPASSVQQADDGTNPTGGLRLVRAQYKTGGKFIDKTTYFRDSLFGHLPWHEASHIPFVEITTVLFQVAIRGKELGDIPLTVRHKPSGAAGQHNYTTSISWGSLGRAVQDANLVGTTGRLLRSVSDPARFRLEIR